MDYLVISLGGILGCNTRYLVGIWAAVPVAGRWAYTAQMPLAPGLGGGIVPILQMLVLPPLIFRIAAVWCGHPST